MPSIRVFVLGRLAPLVFLLCCSSSEEIAPSADDAAADMSDLDLDLDQDLDLDDARSGDDRDRDDRDLPSKPDAAPPGDSSHQPDADSGTGTDAANACQQFKTPIGRALVVTYGSTPIDFSTGTFDCDYNEDHANAEYYWYYIFKSADGKYGLELRLPTNGVACPAVLPLPVSNKALLIFFEAATFTELAASGHPGSAGTLTIEGNIATSTHKEVEIECTNCVLGAVPNTSFDAVQISGSAHQIK